MFKVFETLQPALIADLEQLEADQPSSSSVLFKLPKASNSLKILCAKEVFEWLQKKEPPRIQILDEALSLILNCGSLTGVAFDELARERCRASDSQPKRFALWWCAWLTQNASLAIDFLENILNGIDRDAGDELAIPIFYQLAQLAGKLHFMEAKSKVLQSLQSDLPALERLIPIAYAYIRKEDDIQHENPHWVGLRDHLEDLRGDLVKWLGDIEGRACTDALKRLTENPHIKDHRDWLLHLAQERLEKDAGSAESRVADELLESYREHGTKAMWLVKQFKSEEQHIMEKTNESVEAMDVFLSYASEDSEYAEQIHAAFKERGLKVWFDKTEIAWGDSIYQKIESGLAHTRYGVVIISEAYLEKCWTNAELDGFFQKRID